MKIAFANDPNKLHLNWTNGWQNMPLGTAYNYQIGLYNGTGNWVGGPSPGALPRTIPLKVPITSGNLQAVDNNDIRVSMTRDTFGDLVAARVGTLNTIFSNAGLTGANLLRFDHDITGGKTILDPSVSLQDKYCKNL